MTHLVQSTPEYRHSQDWWYWKTAVKGVILSIQEKHILDLKVSGGIGGSGQWRGGVGGGSTVDTILQSVLVLDCKSDSACT